MNTDLKDWSCWAGIEDLKLLEDNRDSTTVSDWYSAKIKIKSKKNLQNMRERQEKSEATHRQAHIYI